MKKQSRTVRCVERASKMLKPDEIYIHVNMDRSAISFWNKVLETPQISFFFFDRGKHSRKPYQNIVNATFILAELVSSLLKATAENLVPN